MTGDSIYFLGFIEGREWAANWAGDEVLHRMAAGGCSFSWDAAPSGGVPARENGSACGGPLERVTAVLVNRPLAAAELRAFWNKVLPDTDPAMLEDPQFLQGFVAGMQCIAQEPV